MRTRQRGEEIGVRNGRFYNRFNGPVPVTSPLFSTQGEAEGWRPPAQYLVPAVPTFNRVKFIGQTTVDELTPGYFALRRAGKVLPINSFSSTLEDESLIAQAFHCQRRIYAIAGGWRAQFHSNTAWCWGNLPNPPSPGSINWGAMEAAAGARVQLGAWDALTSVSELHKTVALIVGFKRRVREATIRLVRDWWKWRGGRSKGLPTVGRAMREIASFWLEYRYGWRLLYFEYQSLSRVISDLETGNARPRAYETQSLPSSDAEYSSTMTSITGVLRVSSTRTARVSCIGDFKTNVPISFDPINTAWELLPLSFVLDMFWNIGDNIAAFSPLARGDLSFARTLTREVSGTVEWSPINIADYQTFIWDTTPLRQGNLIRSVKTRTPSQGQVGLQSSLNPGFAKALDLGSLTAVLYGTIRGIVRDAS